MRRILIRFMSVFLIFSFALLDFSVQTANALIVDTSTVIAVQQESANRDRVAAFLGRDDVQQVLVQHGVNADEAQQRVASLSDTELAKLAGQIDQLPAGGDGVGAVVGAVVLIFLVLLITDLLGLTHVFPFVHSQR
jgi:hypothetical protein